MDEIQKVRENRLRRAAARQGCVLIKSRRRDRRALDYGAYFVADASTNALVAGDSASGGGLSLDQVETYLSRGAER